MAREQWGSKIGVIMAVAGSAIGLGNFLRFPGQVAQHGGGAFMIPYFISLLLLGLPLIWIEWTIGRFGGIFGHSTAPGMFHSMWEKNRFIKYFGVIGIFGPIVISLYYIYIESWLLAYSFFALAGSYEACTTSELMLSFLKGYQGLEQNQFFSSLWPAYTFFLITFALNGLVLYFGVQRGIERVCKYGVPLLLILAVILVVRVFLLGAPDPAQPENSVLGGLGFMWNPDWSALTRGKVWLAAAGQVFFTLSCGIGVILTYASYLGKNDDVALSGLTAASANEFAEVVLGGSLVIPAAFAFLGASAVTVVAQSGVFNLGFVTMPLVLQKIAHGNFFGFIWFFLLFIAGVTSSISLAQPAIAFLEDEFNLARRQAVLRLMAVIFFFSQPAIFFLGRGVVDEMDFWGGSFFLVVFATVETILFGWVFGMDRAWTELHRGSDIIIPRFYRWIIKYVTPLFLLLILGVWLFQDWLPVLFCEGVSEENLPYIIGTRLMLFSLLGSLALMVRQSWKRREIKLLENGGTNDD